MQAIALVAWPSTPNGFVLPAHLCLRPRCRQAALEDHKRTPLRFASGAGRQAREPLEDPKDTLRLPRRDSGTRLRFAPGASKQVGCLGVARRLASLTWLQVGAADHGQFVEEEGLQNVCNSAHRANFVAPPLH